MRLAQRYASPQFDRCATQDTVLYLRSFSDDHLPVYSPVTDGDLRSLLWPRISFEEFVSYCAAATCGNLITIGKPGERLPRAGAWRSYFDDDAWQEAVRLTMLRCGTILLTVGSTEALNWEIRHVKKWDMLNKCVFLVPPLPEEQARRRLELALDALGIQDDEKNGEIPESPHFIAGFRILPGGSVQWLLCTGRDWGSYFFVWISPTFEVLGRDGFRTWMLSKIAASYSALGNRGEERTAWERCLEAATRAGGVPGATDAHINLALLGRDPTERREHAERALELAESISDARRIAEARELLAHALANERDERWLDDLIDAIRALLDLGESERALGACRRDIVDANVLEDEQAKRKLLELEAEIAGAEGAPHHPASCEARQQH